MGRGSFSQEDVCAARIVSEDEDFVILEVAKHDGVAFTLDPDTPDQFWTILFASFKDGVDFTKPWERG